MFRNFDVYGNFETPIPILCNPCGKELHPMTHALHLKASLRIGSYSELSFELPKYINNEEVKYYDLVQKLRLVKLDNYSVFVINDISEPIDGIKTTKTVSCRSIDALFATKSLISVDGTYKLYDVYGGESMMSMILAKFPDWSIGNVDADLLSLYRTYNISEQNLYDLMMNDLSEDFQCVFKFDTFNKKIYINTTRNATPKTDIFVSFENLLKDLRINSSTSGLKTSLEVYGAEGLSIHDVNPLGGMIYNFSYFKNTTWMSQDTINALNVWEAKVSNNQPAFASNLARIKDLNSNIIKYNIELVDLQGELKSLENILSARATGGLSGWDINQQIYSKNNEIANKKNQIAYAESQLAALNNAQDAIRNNLKLENNLNSAQKKEVGAISNTTSGTYTNDAFVKTSEMSSVEIQEEAQRLYDLALTVLEKECQPIYTFDANIVNFLALKWAKVYASQLQLGCQFTVAIDDTHMFYPVLLEYVIDFDDMTKCTMSFSNALRLNNQNFDFASLFDDVRSAVSSVSTSKGLWEDYIKSGDKDSVFSLKNDALNLATKEIIATSGQDFKIDQTGIRGKKIMPDGSISPNQIWISNNTICMTKDNWNSSSLALGEIWFNGIKKYGLCTEVLVGNLIAGENLVIKNQNNTFTVDANGLTATNASLTLNRSDGNSQIYLNPVDGIRIKSKVDGILQDTFYVDAATGNLTFKGNLTGATGTFSGQIKGSSFVGGSININDKFIVDEYGNCTATSMKMRDGTITGGSININDRFIVDNLGNCTANSMKITGGSFNINNKFKVDNLGNCTANAIDITGGSFNINNNFTVDSSGKCTARDIDVVGGSIDIDEDATIGHNLYMQGGNCAINFGSLASIRSEGSDLFIDGFIEIYRANIKILEMDGDSVATEGYVDEAIEGFSSEIEDINNEIDDLIYDLPVNAVYNSSSKLLKFYNEQGIQLFDVTLE